jgi:beta-fructofuranosidase
MNDPHGIVHDGQRYHLFFQHAPDHLSWHPALDWGHAVSDDLVGWQELPPAITPGPADMGCWSGSVVFAADGTPVMFYTSPLEHDWKHGRIVVADGSPDLATWTRRPGGPLIDGPPPGLGLFDFRDPQVRREGNGWAMVVGAGQQGTGGVVVQYRSPYLCRWSYDGLLATHDPVMVAAAAGGEVGPVWECPQFVAIDGCWVLIVSATDFVGAHMVLAALGDYHGHGFTARRWCRLAHGDRAYATTTFRDRDGRACVMSWLKERDFVAPAGSPWASAQSLPARLAVEGERLTVCPHPDLDAVLPARVWPVGETASGQPLAVGVTWRVQIAIAPGQALRLDVVGEHPWSLATTADGASLAITTAEGTVLGAMPSPQYDGVVDVVVDTDIAEVFATGGEGWLAARVPAQPTATVTVTVTRGD